MSTKATGIKRGRESACLPYSQRSEKLAKAPPSPLKLLQACNVQSLKEQFPTAAKATAFVVEVLKESPRPLAGSRTNSDLRKQVIGKTFQFFPAQDMERDHVAVLLQAFSKYYLSPENFITESINHGNEEFAVKMLSMDIVDLDKVSAGEPFGKRALFDSIKANCARVFDTLVIQRPNLLSCRNLFNDPLIFCAAYQGALKVVRVLVAKGIDESNADYQKTLSLACEKGDAPLAAVLQNTTEDAAKRYIHQTLISSYNRRMGRFHPSLDEVNRRMLLCLINSLPRSRDYFTSGYIIAGQLFQILQNTWPKELESFLSASKKNQLLQALQLAATPTSDKGYAKKLASQIKAGNLVILPAGYIHHSLDLVFYKGYMGICNRGELLPFPPKTVDAFRIDAPSEKNIQDILTFCETTSDPIEAQDYYYKVLPRKLAEPSHSDLCDLIESTEVSLQKAHNCTHANLKLALRVATIMLHIEEEETQFSLSREDWENAQRFAKMLSTFTRLTILEIYLSAHPTFTDDEIDLELLESSYKKALSHNAKTPLPLSHFPNVSQFHQKVEREGFPMPVSIDCTFTSAELNERLLLAQRDKPLDLREIKAMMASNTAVLCSTGYLGDAERGQREHIQSRLMNEKLKFLKVPSLAILF